MSKETRAGNPLIYEVGGGFSQYPTWSRAHANCLYCLVLLKVGVEPKAELVAQTLTTTHFYPKYESLMKDKFWAGNCLKMLTL